MSTDKSTKSGSAAGKIQEERDHREAARREKEGREREEEAEEREKKYKKEAKQRPYKLPIFVRVANLVLGGLFVFLSIFALANEDLTIENTILILAIILGLSGLTRLFNAFYDKEIGGTKRIIRFVIAVLLILLAVAVFSLPNIGQGVLYILLALGLIFQGLGRLIMGVFHKAFPFWLKLGQIAMGAVSIIIGIAAILPELIEIDLPVTTIILLVIGFFISGLSRLTMGLVGLGEQKRKK